MVNRKGNKIGAKGLHACNDCLLSAGGVLPKSERSKPCSCGGEVAYFRSKREFQRWCDLRMLERAGEISRLEFQPAFPITIRGQHIRTIHMDSAYFKGDKRVVEDVKGFMNSAMADAFDLKKKLVEAEYGVEVEVVR